MVWCNLLGATISDAYHRIDGLVTQMGQHLATSTLMTLEILVTDGALAAMLDVLPYDLANPQAPAIGCDDDNSGSVPE